MKSSSGKRQAFRAIHSSSLIRNSGFLLVSTTTTSGLGYLYWLLAARTYAPAPIGLASALISLATLISFMGGLGVGSTNVQILPRLRHLNNQWNTFFTASLALPILATTVLAAVGGGILSTTSHFRVLRSPAVFSAFTVCAAATTAALSMDACFISLRRSDHQFVRNTIFAIGKLPLLAVPLLVTKRPTTFDLLLSWDLALVVSLIVSFAMLLRRSRPNFALTWKGGAEAFLAQGRSIVGYQLETLGGMFPSYLIPPLLVAIVGPKPAAVYYFSWAIGSFLFTVSSSAASALFAEGTNLDELRSHTRQALRVSTFVLIPLAAVAAIFAQPILSLFGANYARQGGTLVRLFVLASIPDGITNIYVATLLIQKRVREAALLNCATGTLAIVGVYVLVRPLGLDGAGLSWLLAQSVGAIIVVRPLWRIVTRSDEQPAVDLAED